MRKAEESTDEELIRQIVQGDTALFRFLIEKYKDVSLSLACSIIKNEQEAEDLLQDAFMKVFRNLKKFNFKSSFATWLYRVVVNTCYTALKKNKARKAFEEQSQAEYYSMPAESLGGLLEEERKTRINAVLKILKPNEALLLRLYYLGELSSREISEITGMSLANIKVTLHRARKNFHELLEKQLGKEKINLL